jgi:hypothetical protein
MCRQGLRLPTLGLDLVGVALVRVLHRQVEQLGEGAVGVRALVRRDQLAVVQRRARVLFAPLADHLLKRRLELGLAASRESRHGEKRDA